MAYLKTVEEQAAYWDHQGDQCVLHRICSIRDAHERLPAMISKRNSLLDEAHVVRQQCDSLKRTEERARQEEQRRSLEAQRREEQQRQQVLSQQQYQRQVEAESRRVQMERQNFMAQQEQARRERFESARRQASSQAQIGRSAFDAALSLLRPSGHEDEDDAGVNRIYKDVAPLKGQLQKYAMPGGSDGAAAAAQEASLNELKRYHSQLARDLDDSIKAAEQINPWADAPSSRAVIASASSTYRPAGTLSVDTVAQPQATIDATAELQRSIEEAASDSAAEGALQSAQTDSGNPWADPPTAQRPGSGGPFSSNPRSAEETPPDKTCKAKLTARHRYKYVGAGGVTCYSTQPGAGATNANSICCK